MKQTYMRTAVAFAALAIGAGSALAQTTLIDEDFQSPLLSDGTKSPAFPGWTWITGDTVSSRLSPSNGLPGDDDVTGTNQGIQFEWTSGQAHYDIAHNWATSDFYILRINAAPQDWSKTGQRYIRPSLRQQDGTVLWAPGENLTWPDKTALPKDVSFGSSTWQAEPELNFTFLIDASTFTEGSPGLPIALRIASSGSRGLYVDNVSLTVGTAPVDNTPPSPDPPTWEVVPTVDNFKNTTMTANAVGDDLNGVQYYFENTVKGTNSGWQWSRTWNETGLDFNTLYTYQVKARDTSPANNQTGWSSALDVTTDPDDTTPPNPDPPTWEVNPEAGDYGTVTMTVDPVTDLNGVEYYFENMDTGGNSGWQDGRTWVDVDLDHGTPYTYRVKAQDKFITPNGTGWSSELDATTLSVPAGTLVITRFQSPTFSNGTTLVDGDFGGWTFPNGPKLRLAPDNGLPGDTSVTGPNQGLQFEQTNDEAQYDIDHSWAATDVYTLTVNAAPQDWNKQAQRYIRPSLRQQDGTVLWDPGENLSGPEKTALPVDASFGGSTWQAESDLNFTFTINASTFTAGTEGQPIALRLDSSGEVRGIYVDNVTLSLSTGGTGDPYADWAADAGGNFLGTLTDPTATLDFDGGGLATGIEWVVGGDPTDGSDDAGNAPTGTDDGTNLVFTYNRSDAAEADAKTAIKAEYGTDLTGWTDAVNGVDGVVITVTDGSPFDLVEVKIPMSLAAPGTELYARLNVVITP